MPTALQQKTEELNARRDQWLTIYEAGGEEKSYTDEQVAEMKRLNDEMEPLGAEVARLGELAREEKKHREAIAESKTVHRDIGFAAGRDDQPEPEAEVKSIGDLFLESKAYTEWSDSNHKGPIDTVPFEFKATFNTSTGFAPQAIRTGQVILSAQQQPRIVDVIPSVQTDQNAVVFMKESTFTNTAAEVAEAAAYPEAGLAYTEVSMPVRKVAVFIPATDESMADVPGTRDRLNNRLNLMLAQRLDQEIVSGDGVAPDLTGILNTAGILTQALAGGDANADAIFKGIIKLQNTGFVEPNAILMNPLNWQSVRLLKTSTGEYIFGYPGDPGVARLWGLPLVMSTFVTANTAIVADFANYTELAYKAGMEFEVSNSHSDFFTKGILAIRAQLRVAFVVLRPSAICSVTGLN